MGIMAFVDLPLELLGDDVHSSFLGLLWIGQTLKDAFKDDLIERQPPREKGLAAVYRPADVELLRDLLKPGDVGGVLVDGPDVSQDEVDEKRALALLGGLGEHALAFDVVIAPEALLKDGLVPFELFREDLRELRYSEGPGVQRAAEDDVVLLRAKVEGVLESLDGLLSLVRLERELGVGGLLDILLVKERADGGIDLVNDLRHVDVRVLRVELLLKHETVDFI